MALVEQFKNFNANQLLIIFGASPKNPKTTDLLQSIKRPFSEEVLFFRFCGNFFTKCAKVF